MTNNRNHIWPKAEVLLSFSDSCLKCNFSIGYICEYLEQNAEKLYIVGQPKTLETINEYFPCLTDEEVIVKEIIE